MSLDYPHQFDFLGKNLELVSIKKNPHISFTEVCSFFDKNCEDFYEDLLRIDTIHHTEFNGEIYLTQLGLFLLLQETGLVDTIAKSVIVFLFYQAFPDMWGFIHKNPSKEDKKLRLEPGFIQKFAPTDERISYTAEDIEFFYLQYSGFSSIEQTKFQTRKTLSQVFAKTMSTIYPVFSIKRKTAKRITNYFGLKYNP